MTAPWSPDPLPPLGFRYEHDGQSYECVGTHPYVTVGRRAPGRTVTIIEWRTECPTCGIAFIATSTRAGTPHRRCKAHRKPGLTVAAERRKAAAP